MTLIFCFSLVFLNPCGVSNLGLVLVRDQPQPLVALSLCLSWTRVPSSPGDWFSGWAVSFVLSVCFPSSKSTPCVYSHLKSCFDLGRGISRRLHTATLQSSSFCGRGQEAAERSWAAQGCRPACGLATDTWALLLSQSWVTPKCREVPYVQLLGQMLPTREPGPEPSGSVCRHHAIRCGGHRPHVATGHLKPGWCHMLQW